MRYISYFLNEEVKLYNTVFNEFSFAVINDIGHLKLGLKGQNDEVSTMYLETYSKSNNLFKLSYPDDIKLSYKEYLDNNFDDFATDVIKLLNKNILGYRFKLKEAVNPKYIKPYAIIESIGKQIKLNDFEILFDSLKNKNKMNKEYWFRTIK